MHEQVAACREGRRAPKLGNSNHSNWSDAEDTQLHAAVDSTPRDGQGRYRWATIAQQVPGRNGVQCQERWNQVIDPNIDHSEWRDEEVDRLHALVEQMGTRWEAVAKALGVELEAAPPRAVVKMIDAARGGTLLKSKPPGRKVVRVAIHVGTPLVALLSADDDPALLDKDRLMKPGTAQLVSRRHVRYEAAGDFIRTVDFYLGGDEEAVHLKSLRGGWGCT